MDEPEVRPRILLFDEFGMPLLVKYPPKKQPIGFVVEEAKKVLPIVKVETI
jgi:hypothetical protein